MHVVNLAFFDVFITIFGWPTKAHSAFVAGFERIVFFAWSVVLKVKSFPADHDRVSLIKCSQIFETFLSWLI